MFDKKFTLKIADFGLATKVSPNGMISNSGGTPSFMAPEITAHVPYNGYAADIFACGVILFQMVVGENLFECSRKSDPVYKLVFDENYDKFWEKVNPNGANLPTDLKHLI